MPQSPSKVIVVPPGGRYVGEGSGGGVGGTTVASSGKIISAGRGSTVGSSSPKTSGYTEGYQGTSKTSAEQVEALRQKDAERQDKERRETIASSSQRSAAQRVLGVITRVDTNQYGEVTYYGFGDKKYTFPSKEETIYSGGKTSLSLRQSPVENKTLDINQITSSQQALLLTAIGESGESRFTRLARQRASEAREELPYPERTSARLGELTITGTVSPTYVYMDYSPTRKSAQLAETTLLFPGEYVSEGMVYSPAKTKRYAELTEKERLDYTANVLRQKTKNPLEDYYVTLAKSYNPRDYDKFKPKQAEENFIQINYPVFTKGGVSSKSIGLTAQQTKDMAWQSIYPLRMQLEGVSKILNLLFEKAGQGLGYGAAVYQKYTGTSAKVKLGQWASDPRSFSFGDLVSPWKTEASRSYEEEGIYFRTAADTTLAFVYPFEKAVVEASKSNSKLSNLEKITYVGIGSAWSAGGKLAKYSTEKTLASNWLARFSSAAPKPAKIATLGIKGTEKAIEYGLPAAYVTGSFISVAAMPTVEGKRYQSERISEEFAYMTFGALPAGALSGRAIKEADALSRIYDVKLFEVSKNKKYSDINSAGIPLSTKYNINLISIKKKADFLRLNRIVRPEVIPAYENFPTASKDAQIQYNLFVNQRKYTLPFEMKSGGNRNAGYHATPSQLPKDMSIASGSSEVPGLYISSEASIYFLKLRGEGYTSYSFAGESTLSPSILRQQVLGFKKIPKSFKGKLSTEELQKLAPDFNIRPSYKNEIEYMLTKGKKGYAYVIGKKTEIESGITPGSQSRLKSIPYYTKVPSIEAARKYEFFGRRGYSEAVRRAKTFRISKPSTYWDKLLGYKGGQIKEFGIRRGQRVPIELREMLGEEISASRKTSGRKYGSSSDESRRLSSKSEAFNLSSLFRYSKSSAASSTKSSTSSMSSRASSLKSYISSVSSSISRLSSSVSRASSRISSTSSSSRSYYSRVTSRASSSSSSSSGSSGRYSYTSSKITRDKIPVLLPSLLRNPTSKKGMKATKFMWQPSVIAVDKRIYQQGKKFSTGLDIRGI